MILQSIKWQKTCIYLKRFTSRRRNESFKWRNTKQHDVLVHIAGTESILEKLLMYTQLKCSKHVFTEANYFLFFVSIQVEHAMLTAGEKNTTCKNVTNVSRLCSRTVCFKFFDRGNCFSLRRRSPAERSIAFCPHWLYWNLIITMAEPELNLYSKVILLVILDSSITSKQFFLEVKACMVSTL